MRRWNIGQNGVAAALAIAMIGGSAALAQPLLTYIDSSDDILYLADPQTGALVSFDFIADNPSEPGYNLQTPKEATQVGNEVWVSDQISDAIYRFGLVPSQAPFLGAIGPTGLDNIRGFGVVNNRVYVSNSGTNNSAPGRAIVVYELDGTFVSSFQVINPLNALPVDPFDVEDFNGRLLISDIEGDDIIVCDVDGSNPSVLIAGGGSGQFNFPQQVHVAPSGPSGEQEIWFAAFSAVAGVYRYTTSGTLIAHYPVTTGGRGVWWLPPTPEGDQQFIFCDGVTGGGVRLRNITQSTTTPIQIGSAQYVGRVTIPEDAPCDSIDFNNDTSFFDPQDIEAFLSVYSEGDCIPAGATCNDIDFNNDTSVFDPCDIASFLTVYAEGPCLPCGE